MKPIRLDMTHHLIVGYELHKHLEVYVRPLLPNRTSSGASLPLNESELHAEAPQGISGRAVPVPLPRICGIPGHSHP